MSDSGRVWGAEKDSEIRRVKEQKQRLRVERMAQKIRDGAQVRIKSKEWDALIDAYEARFGVGAFDWKCCFKAGEITISEVHKS